MRQPPQEYELIRIVHPDNPSYSLLIAKHDYNPAVHKLAEHPEQQGEGDIAPPPDRAAELRSLYRQGGWRAIKSLADQYGIERPAAGWDSAIDLIVEAERRAK
jgi:hypothetical protein